MNIFIYLSVTIYIQPNTPTNLFHWHCLLMPQCIYIQIYAHIYICIYIIYTHTNTHIYIYIYIYICMRIFTFLSETIRTQPNTPTNSFPRQLPHAPVLYIYTYLKTLLCTYTYVYICIQINAHIFTCIHIIHITYLYIHTNMCKYLYIQIYAHIHTCICIIYIHIYVYKYKCIYIQIYAHIYTCTYKIFIQIYITIYEYVYIHMCKHIYAATHQRFRRQLCRLIPQKTRKHTFQIVVFRAKTRAQFVLLKRGSFFKNGRRLKHTIFCLRTNFFYFKPQSTLKKNTPKKPNKT